MAKAAQSDVIAGVGLADRPRKSCSIVSVLFMAHAFLALRKFPADYPQYRLFIGHRNVLRHADTGL